MPLSHFPVPQSDEPTSVKFWTDFNRIVTVINTLETRITALETLVATHIATPKAHG